MKSASPRKSLIPAWALLLSSSVVGLSAASVSAAIAVAVDEPYSLASAGGQTTLYLASSTTAAILDEGGYSTWDPATDGRRFGFRITGMDLATKPFIKAHINNSTIFIPIQPGPGTAAVGGVLTNTSGYAALQFTATEGIVYVDFVDICQYNTAITGCSSSAVNVAPNNPGITLVFSAYADANAATTAAEDPVTVLTKYVVNPVTPTCPNPGFFPSDEAIIVDSGLFSFTAASDGTSATTVRNLLVVANEDPTPVNTGAVGSNSIRGRVPWNTGEQTLRGVGFRNVDPAAVPPTPVYNIVYAAVDPSGLTTLTAPMCSQGNVFASDIQGFLKESNCFVATASYRDPNAPGVNLLRRFRDGVLTKFAPGRMFVKFYYNHGPDAAQFVLEHPVLRVPVLMFLIPIQFMAWALTEPLAYLAVALFGLSLAIGIRFLVRRGLHRAFVKSLILALLVGGAIGVPVMNAQAQEAEGTSSQPYIDSLLSTMDPPAVERTNENPDPYIQNMKRKLGNPESSEGYSESIRKDLDPAEDTRGYAEKIRDRTPPAGSAIQDLRDGKTLKADKGDDRIRSVIGFDIGVTTNPIFGDDFTARDRPYSDVYGDRWVPNLKISYEFRPWLTGLGSVLGIHTSVGTTFVRGDGRFAVNPADVGRPEFGTTSRTKFRFITIPFQVGPMMRLRLGKVLSPFAGVGPGVMGFMETRSDDQESMRGYSWSYWTSFGLNIGLDWLSPKSSWETYQANEIKRTFLSVGFHRVATLPGGLVDMSSSGVMAGFTFEL